MCLFYMVDFFYKYISIVSKAHREYIVSCQTLYIHRIYPVILESAPYIHAKSAGFHSLHLMS